MPTSSFSGRQLEDGARGLGVHVLAALEDLAQTSSPGDVREHAQLDLRVVDAEQHVAGLGDEAGADLAAVSVRIGMFCRFGLIDASRPGGGVDLQERRVDAAVGAM
jgi:hypothetical protein